jgi:hypothetical protein
MNNEKKLIVACKSLIDLMLDKTALNIYDEKKGDDLGSMLFILTHQFNHPKTKAAIKLLKQIESASQ